MPATWDIPPTPERGIAIFPDVAIPRSEQTQSFLLAVVITGQTPEDNRPKAIEDAQREIDRANAKFSNRWRMAGIVMFCAALVCFGRRLLLRGKGASAKNGRGHDRLGSTYEVSF